MANGVTVGCYLCNNQLVFDIEYTNLEEILGELKARGWHMRGTLFADCPQCWEKALRQAVTDITHEYAVHVALRQRLAREAEPAAPPAEGAV